MIKDYVNSLLVITLLTMTVPDIAFAYIGPGAGISLIGSFLGILVAVFIAVFALIAWPIRRMLKARKAKNISDKNSNNSDHDRSGFDQAE